MTYIINYSDSDKSALEVFDNTTNRDTSLVFPGRNLTGYAQIFGENLLHLLENFANNIPPINPKEGQLWYNSDTSALMISDGTATSDPATWKFASGVYKGASEPTSAKAGDLWADTSNQQLKIYSGTTWILVGPERATTGDGSQGYKTGIVIETVADTNNINRTIIVAYENDIPVTIISKDSFVPKLSISGFPNIRSGINLPIVSTLNVEQFEGGFPPILYGSVNAANALNITGEAEPVVGSKFLRNDKTNTVEYRFNIKTNDGITIGNNSSFRITNDSTSIKLYNSAANSPIDLQVNRNGLPSTVVRVSNNKVGINKLDPQEALDVVGNIVSSGTLSVSSSATVGSLSATGNLSTGANLTVTGTSTVSDILPSTTQTYNLGSASKKWNGIWTKSLTVDELTVNLVDGNITGNADTANSAGRFTNALNITLQGDVASNIAILGPDQTNKTFNVTLTSDIISNKPDPVPNRSSENDYVLTWRVGTGLLKQSRDTFIGDQGMPIGAIIPFAGTVVPAGYLLCDGGEVEKTKYPRLWSVIGNTYLGTSSLVGANTFRLPDLRGRFALGRDNMDNGNTVPDSLGNQVNAGGGNIGRNPDTSADTIGGTGGATTSTLSVENLPEHEHRLQKNNVAFSALRITNESTSFSRTGPAPSKIGEAQYIDDTGGIKVSTGTTLGRPINLTNPYLTINYIIRSGLAAS